VGLQLEGVCVGDRRDAEPAQPLQLTCNGR
jgi:hypothetical protein